MRRTIVMLIAAAMISGIFTQLLPMQSVGAEVVQDGNQHATIILSNWHMVGHDEYGDPLSGGKSFPWQHEGESVDSYWGSDDYGMPNAVSAITTAGVARAARRQNYGMTTTPMLWTTVYLTIVADDGGSRPIIDEKGDLEGLGRWYVIMDSAGQVWFDPDGRFHDSRYLAQADPFSPYYMYIEDEDGNAFGACLENPTAKVDPSEMNNTQGPYQFSPTTESGEENPFYVEPCYFWIRPNLTKIVNAEAENTCDAYSNHTLRGESRAWQLGIASRPDYLAQNVMSPFGNVSDGLVREGEWDIGVSLLPFMPNEQYTDNYQGNGTAGAFDSTDHIYRNVNYPAGGPPYAVEPGDVRLTSVTVGVAPNTNTFLAGSVVQPSDLDVGEPLNAIPTNIRYAISEVGEAAAELEARNLGALNPAGWSTVSTMGTTVLSLTDVSNLTAGSAIQIGPNDAGQSDICNVVAIINTAPAYNQYYTYLSGHCPYGYELSAYDYYINGSFNPGDYIVYGRGATSEIFRLDWVNYAGFYPNYMGYCYYYSSYTGFDLDRPLYFNHAYDNNYNRYYSQDTITKIDQGVILDCATLYDYEAGTPITILGYQPGDFIYRQLDPNEANVAIGDIRLSNVDGHRIGGFQMGQGAYEFDALVMNEILFADPNDPRYQASVRNSDWNKSDFDFNIQSTVEEESVEFPYGACMPTYDISVESDFWQGERVWRTNSQGQWESEWQGVIPSVTACALRSPNDDVDDAHHRIAKQTVLGPYGDSFFIHTATIHNVQPDYREYLGIEIFCDNGYDNLSNPNPAGVGAVALDLNDNYMRGTVCEPYVGATSRAPDLDLNRDLVALDGSTDNPKFVDTDNLAPVPDGPGNYGCNEPIYFDMDNDGFVSPGDKRGSNVEANIGLTVGGQIFTYEVGTIVQQGDSDVGRILSRFRDPLTNEPVYKYYDNPHAISRLPSGVWEYGENIYWDHPEPPDFPGGDGKTDPGDIRLTDVNIGGTSYFCGETVGIGDVFALEYPVYMISTGKNGDYNYMDFQVLPFPTMDVKVDIDKPLKVEQTSNITIEVNPPPAPGESIFVALRETTIEPRMPMPAVQFYSMENVTGEWLNYTCDGQSLNAGLCPAQADAYRYVTLPWPFTFFGQTSDQIGISNHVYVDVGPGYNYLSSIYYNYCWYAQNSTYERYNYGRLPAKLSQVGRPPRINVLNYWWNSEEVCWGDAVWPATGETVYVITWRGQMGMYYYYRNGARMEVQLILFQNGQILIQYKQTGCPSYWYPSWYGYTYYETGITNGSGVYYEWDPGAPCAFGMESNVLFTPGEIPAKAGVPKVNIAEDAKWMTQDNPVASFEFTPYRGTCLEDGTRKPMEINLYRDAGGLSEPVPRNPPPNTYLTYQEPSFSTRPPIPNGRVIAIGNPFGYLEGDWILIGDSTNSERRRIEQIHVGTEGASTEVLYQTYRSTQALPSYHIPVESVKDFTIGNPVIVGHSHTGNQETHIIEGLSRGDVSPGEPSFWSTGIRYPYPQTGTNVTLLVNNASGFQIGDYIGYGYTNGWWNANPINNGRDIAKIIDIDYGANSLTLDVIHTYWYYWNYYVCTIEAVEVRDPLKFVHYGDATSPYGEAEPVFTTKFAFTLNRGLNYDHYFGEPVIGMQYFDPFWADNKWGRFDLDMYPSRQFAAVLPPDDVSPNLDSGYDCYWRGRFNIAPEEIVIDPERDCLHVLDTRFPNVLLNLYDADNPNDVNDPANIPISCPGGVSGVDQTIIANVNATGAGVKYLMTAGQSSPPRYIVQVNDDGTYEWWRWYEPLAATQIFGALDPNDWLYRWLDMDVLNFVNPATRSPLPVHDNTYELRLTDNDCSKGGGVCDPCNNGTLWPCLGDITINDAYGRFMGTISDPYSNYPNPQSLPANFGRIENFGIPCVIDRWTLGSDGGQIMFPVKPLKGGTLDIRVYTYQAVFDYNSSNIHAPGPYFTEDTSYGIDYCGYYQMKVIEKDADVNFIEFRMVDHALQNSRLNYTTGVNPLYPMPSPAPRIQRSYDPIIRDYGRQLRSYPGGQTHTGRLTGGAIGNGNRWNAYPAIWENMYVKLGTEFYPLTDYGMYFFLLNGDGNHIGWPGMRDSAQEPNLAVRYMRIKGPFMRPKYYYEPSLNCVLGGSDSPWYEYNNVLGLPISYDYSGQIDVDPSNFGAYCPGGGADLSQIGNPSSSTDSFTYKNANTWLTKWKDLYYGGFWQVSRSNFNAPVADPVTPCYPYLWVFDEIIPVSSGDITIELELMNGVKKVYQDCCVAELEGTKDGIPVHGLKIEGAPQYVTVDDDNVFELTVTEDTGKGMLNNDEWLNIECNDAVLFAWQDRGVVDPGSKYWLGPLDGQITMPPISSDFSNVEYAYELVADVNDDNKVSYEDWETEIVGTYDMATNTWLGGMIDARTFQRENGQYKIELTKEWGAQIDVVGIDIGGVDENGRPLLRNHVDHIVDENELVPLNITAYKYGDDNNDRAFTPLYDQVLSTGYSHEVYLAGQVTIGVEPKRDLSVTYGPEPLTAGVIPEKLGDPLTLYVTDYNGEPVNLTMGMADAHGDYEVIGENIWRNLFKDPHPDNEYYYGNGVVLPQYYWMRTDLHNDPDSITNICNTGMYNSFFLPIKFGMDAEKGVYSFSGFIANDKGDFEIYVYTPDRRHSGVVTVKVVNPTVTYEIVNKDEINTIFDVPSTTDDPDFVMTAGDNRAYIVTATCRNAQDALLKGVAKGVSVCSGQGEDIARFTPSMTVLNNFWYQGYYYNTIGVDFNNDGALTSPSIAQSEFAEVKPIADAIYYNTHMTRYTDGSYALWLYTGADSWYPGPLNYMWFLDRRNESQFLSPPRSFGLGAIYNDLYHGTYMFADLNGDNSISFRDSLSLDEQGRTTFYVYTDDACYLTGLVGYNDYCNVSMYADVAGYPSYYTEYDPNYSRYRYPRNFADGVYALDWEAWADTELEIGTPRIEIIEPLSGEEWRKDLLDENYYDLVYGVKNHMLIRVYPADMRDLPIAEETVIGYSSADKSGNNMAPRFETTVMARLVESEVDPSAREANLYVDPTGTGSYQAGLFMRNERKNTFNPMILPTFSSNLALTVFDVVKGMEIIPEVASALKVGQETTLSIKVVVAGGANEPLEGISVTLDDANGVVDSVTAKTNAKGVAEFTVTPKKAGRIVVKATSDVYGKAYSAVGVEVEVVPPMLVVNPVKSVTKESKIEITGKTSIGVEVEINTEKVKVADDGTFKHSVNLQEGFNSIDVEAVNSVGMATSVVVNVVRDSTPPSIILDQKDVVFGPTITLTGKVEPYSVVTVNGVPAEVVYDNWRVELTDVDNGALEVEIKATDPAGNESEPFKATLTVVTKKEMVLHEGSTSVTINGDDQRGLTRAPYVDGLSFMVPVQAFSTFFGNAGDPVVNGDVATVTINGISFEFTNGTKLYTQDDTDFTMPKEAKLEFGVMFVDAIYLASTLGLETSWNAGNNELRIYEITD